MRTFILSFFLLFAVAIDLEAGEEPYLILNMANHYKLPKNFRIDPALNASGSGQFSAKSLEAMLRVLPKDRPILIVDLRQESHGFADGTAISWRLNPHNWANLHKTFSEVLQDESSRLQLLENQKVTLIYTKGLVFPFWSKKTFTEEDLAHGHGLQYLRLPVTDHRKPMTEEVDRFIQHYRQLPHHSWIHFHCAAGKGRSTAFLAMYDILKNAKTDSLQTILERQFQLGGVNYLAPEAKQIWKQSDYESKQIFLQKFYEYCQKSNPKNVLWSEWILKNSNS